MPIVECIPNFSEGRDETTVQALIETARAVSGVWLLDHTSDPDHHRSVLTVAGEPAAVEDAAYRMIRTAAERIDLRRHTGVHPRIGAADVVPFVPIEDVTMDECIQMARRLGERVGRELKIPVFLYEQAAALPHRSRLESIRRGGLPDLAGRMATDPAWQPDFGPARPHESAGAVVIGARHPLIAFNVNLATADLAVAKSIARTVRQSSGGLPSVKAIGVTLASRGLVQVSMNLTDYRVTSMAMAFLAVMHEAAKAGIAVAGSELIGLVPQAALDQAAATLLRMERFDPEQILETRLRNARTAATHSYEATPVAEFLQAVAAPVPTPAGGSVAALVGALAASLGTMGARIGAQPDAEQRLIMLGYELQRCVQADCNAYEKVGRARRLPKEQRGRIEQLAAAMTDATDVPLRIAECACEAGILIASLRRTVSPSVQSDLTVGMILARAAAEAGLHTAQTNINLQQNQQVANSFVDRMTKIVNCLEELKGLCYTPPPVA